MNQPTQTTVRQATIVDLDRLVPLFDSYRQFYRMPSDIAMARHFLLERFRHNQSTIFLAEQSGGAAVGFTQLYPGFSSASMAPILILNDLFVDQGARCCGAGTLLLNAAAAYGVAIGAVRLTLSTEVTNAAAQSLYENRGWVRQNDFYVYTLPLAG